MARFTDGELTLGEFRKERTRAQSKLAAIEAKMADAGGTNVLGPLVLASDVQAAWEASGTDRQRAVIDALMIVKIMSPGRGNRAFNPETVIIEPRL